LISFREARAERYARVSSSDAAGNSERTFRSGSAASIAARRWDSSSTVADHRREAANRCAASPLVPGPSDGVAHARTAATAAADNPVKVPRKRSR